jgi:hypothetical protein
MHQAHQVRVKNFADDEGQAKGKELVDSETGQAHYTNFNPHFSVDYYPQRQPQQILYCIWERRHLLVGYDLADTYKRLKANVDEMIVTSSGPREVGKPYILKVELLSA